MNHLVNADVVDDVGDKERAGNDEGGNHETFVELNFAGTNRDVAAGEENGTGTIERGVEGGVGHGFVGKAFWGIVEQNIR